MSHVDPNDPTRLQLFIDTHIVDAVDTEATFLRRLHDHGWLKLLRSDAMDTEMLKAPPEKAAALTEASSHFQEVCGPAVWDNSRWDHAVWSGPADVARWDLVFYVLFPNVDRETARSNHVKDAMHVAAAIRHGADAFVTREKRLLNKSDSIAFSFQGFRIWSPGQALVEARQRVARLLEPGQANPDSLPLPDWRPQAAEWPTP